MGLDPPILNSICHCEEAEGRRGNLIKQSIIIIKYPPSVWQTSCLQFIPLDIKFQHCYMPAPVKQLSLAFTDSWCIYSIPDTFCPSPTNKALVYQPALLHNSTRGCVLRNGHADDSLQLCLLEPEPNTRPTSLGGEPLPPELRIKFPSNLPLVLSWPVIQQIEAHPADKPSASLV